jgi:hypothetical protein
VSCEISVRRIASKASSASKRRHVTLSLRTLGYACIDLPVKVEIEEGKEVIRDRHGRMQGVVERTFANVSWDEPKAAA